MSSSVRLRTCRASVAADAIVDLSEADRSPAAGYIHFGIVQAIRTVLAERGADFDDLVAEAGLDPRVFGGRLVPFTALGHLLALGASRTSCAHLGLLVGQRATLDSLGLIGLLMRNSGTVEDALRAL